MDEPQTHSSLVGRFLSCGGPRLLQDGSLLWALAWLIPLALLLAAIPSAVAKRLAIPVALILLNLFSTYALGELGLVTSGVALVYGFSSLAWLIPYKQASLQLEAGQVALAAAGFAVALVACLLCASPARRRDYLRVAALVCAITPILWWAATDRRAELLSSWAARAIVIGSHLLVICYAAEYIAVRITRWWLAGHRREGIVRMVGVAGPPLLIGCALVLVAGLSSRVLPEVPALLIVALCCLACLALATRWSMHGRRNARLLLLPIVTAATIALCATAPVTNLPPYRPGIELIGLCQNGTLAQLLAEGAWALAHGCSRLFGGPLATVLQALMRKKAFASLSDELVAMGCLYVALALAPALVRLATWASAWLRMRDRQV